jgi:hypothetical protein
MSEGNKRKPPPQGWPKGTSGNPKGKPPGCGAVQKLRAAIEHELPEVIEAVVRKARDGDVGAARLLLERVCPPIKAAETPVAFAMPDGSLTERGQAILGAISAGEIPPSAGASLMTALGAMSKLQEVDDLSRRVAQLEEARDAAKRH